MTIRTSTKKWLAAFAIAMVLNVIDGGDADRLGLLGGLAWLVAMASGFVLAFRAIKAAFRTIVRRLSLRLAFSYFLIGIVPIPLLACLLLAVGYMTAFQFVGGRLRREIQAVADATSAGKPGASPIEIRDEKVSSSTLDWLPAGTPVPWVSKAGPAKLLLVEDKPWLAAGEVKNGHGQIFLRLLGDPEVLQELADRTGYVVQAESGTAGTDRRQKGVQIDMTPGKAKEIPMIRRRNPTRRSARGRGRRSRRARPSTARSSSASTWHGRRRSIGRRGETPTGSSPYSATRLRASCGRSSSRTTCRARAGSCSRSWRDSPAPSCSSISSLSRSRSGSSRASRATSTG